MTGRRRGRRKVASRGGPSPAGDYPGGGGCDVGGGRRRGPRCRGRLGSRCRAWKSRSGLVEVDDVGAPIVVGLASVVSGEAAEHDAIRTTASNVVRRAKDRIRTGMDRISVGRPPGFSSKRGTRGPANMHHRGKDTSMLFASAVPLRPGKTDRYRDLATELRPHLEEYQDLNRRFEVGRPRLLDQPRS